MHLRPRPLYVLLLCLLLSVLPSLGGSAGLCAQSAEGGGASAPPVSPVFPAERHAELRSELRYEVKAPPEPEEPDDLPDFFENFDITLSSGMATAILILLGLPLLYLIFRIVSDIRVRRRRKGVEDRLEGVDINEIEEERLVEEGVSLSLFERAEAAGQFDVAVRLQYIQLLKELKDAHLIRYRRDFSNRDYQRQLAGHELLPDFRGVTVDYERFWYGKYPIDRLSYKLVKDKFTELRQRTERIANPAAAEEQYDFDA